MKRIAVGMVAVLVVAALAAAAPGGSGSKKARRLLKMLTTVDGAGSGLDADTVRGRTVEDYMTGLVVGPPGPEGPQGPPGPPGPAAGGDLLVRDATGAIVGKVVGAGSPTLVVREVDFAGGVRRPLAFPVTRSGFADTRQDIVFWYTAFECTSLARFLAPRGVLIPTVNVKRGTNVATPDEGWLPGEEPDGGFPRLILKSRALFLDDDPCTAAGGIPRRPRTGLCCFDETPFEAPVADAIVVPLGDLGFQPPFRVEVPPLP